MDRGVPTVVMENGSGVTKAGFAGDDEPRATFPTVVAWPRYPLPSSADRENPFWFGHEAKRYGGIAVLKYPVERGIIVDWDKLEKLWDHTFYKELCVAPEEHPLVLTDSVHDTRPAAREKMIQIAFESFCVPSFYVAKQPPLSLRASGRQTGLVVDCGDDMTSVVPVLDGVPILNAISDVPVSGRDLTYYLRRDPDNHNLWFTNARMKEIQDIKEKHCYVALNYEQEAQIAATSSRFEVKYKSPEIGEEIFLNDERFRVPEALFRPDFVGFECSGLHDVIQRVISKCDPAIQPSLYANLVLAGGTTMLPGFGERLHKELAVLAPANMPVNVISDPRRGYSAWLGGGMLASADTFTTMAISKEEYDDYGPAIVHRKCQD